MIGRLSGLVVDLVGVCVGHLAPPAAPAASSTADEPVDVEHRLPASRLYWLLVAAGMRVAADPESDPLAAADDVLLEIDLRGVENLARPTERTT